MSESIIKLRAEWESSRLLRGGIYVLLGTLWLYGILVLKDFVAVERKSWEAMESKTSRAKATAVNADWPMRAQEMKVAISDLESLLWREGSVGLSQASFEEKISLSVTQAGIPLRSIRTTAVTDGATTASPLGLIELRARLQLEFRPTTFYPWLAAVTKGKFEKAPTMFVENLSIRAASLGQPGYADLELVGYALKAAPSSATTISATSATSATPGLGANK
jgi:hypothetical protein